MPASRSIISKLDTEALEESLLGQMLFAESYIGNAQTVFMSYYRYGTNRLLIRAYLNYHAYKYLTKDRALPDELFEIMERDAERILHLCLTELLPIPDPVMNFHYAFRICAVFHKVFVIHPPRQFCNVLKASVKWKNNSLFQQDMKPAANKAVLPLRCL